MTISIVPGHASRVPFPIKTSEFFNAIGAIGTPACTTRGFGQVEFRKVGQWIGEIADGLKANKKDNSAAEAKVREEVLALTARFPIYNG